MVKVSPTSLSLPRSTVNSIKICIQTDSPSYSPGSKVTGRLHISSPSPLTPRPITLELVGTEFCRWKEEFKGVGEHREEIMTVTRTGNREIRRERIGLNQLPGGKMVKFSFVLPRVVPASGQFEDGNAKAGVAYHLTASLPDESIPVACPNVDLVIVPPAEKFPTSATDLEEIVTCCCLSCGWLKVKTALQKTDLVVGETVNVGVAIEGKKCTVGVTEVSAKLVQKVLMKSQEGNTFVKETVIAEVKQNTAGKPAADFSLTFNLVATYLNGMPLCPTVKTGTFQCTYLVRIETVVNTLGTTVRTVDMLVHLSLDVIQVNFELDEDVCSDSEPSSFQQASSLRHAPSLQPASSLQPVSSLQQRASSLFRQFDSDRNGYLSPSELYQALSSLCREFSLNEPPRSTLDLAMQRFDADKNGFLDQTEFEQLVEAILTPQTEGD